MTLTKSQLIRIIQEETGLPKVDVIKFLIVFISIVKETLQKGNVVSIQGFGAFHLKRKHNKYSKLDKKSYQYASFIAPHWLLSPYYDDKEMTYEKWEEENFGH